MPDFLVILQVLLFSSNSGGAYAITNAKDQAVFAVFTA
jgi:hypothetical protein